MTKQEITEFIKNKKDYSKSILTFIDSETEKPFFESIIIKTKQVSQYLDLIMDDLEKDIIPEYFFSRIYNNVNSINIDRLFQLIQNFNTSNPEYSRRQISDVLENQPINPADLTITYKFYKDLDFFKKNIVIVGSNGSGKSTLASHLKKTISEKDGIVLPAQKLLIIPTFDSIPNYAASSSQYDEYQQGIIDTKSTYNASTSNDLPFQEIKKYGSEYRMVLSTLLAERNSIRNKFCDDFEKGIAVAKNNLNSKLDRAIGIWNFLIEHREMQCDENNALVIKDKESQDIYPSYKMSDGEKIIFYLIGRILLSPKGAMIIIDEPEMYLHKAIVNKLWDKLEFERNDCTFIYLTHDLTFASSRLALKYWIREFTFPNKWLIETIPQNVIPEKLLMKLLGSRKKILFCEGDNEKSLDIKIFEILFPSHTITPVKSCTEVINYVRTFNKLSNRNADAIGIIDKDFRTEEQIKKLTEEQIYVHNVSEIENLFLTKEFIESYGRFKNETIEFKNIENNVFKLLKKDKELQASNFLSNAINFKFAESHLKKGNTPDKVKENFEEFISTINLDELYKRRISEIEKIIETRNYQEAISIYNNKGLLKVVEDAIGLKSNNYRFKAIEFLKIDTDAQNIIRKILPDKL